MDHHQAIPAPDGHALAVKIRNAALAIGYADCGFTACDPFPDYLRELRRRGDDNPSSAALYRNLAQRADPRATAPWAQSIVVAIRPYGKYVLPRSALGHIGRNYLADRRLPGCPDHSMPRQMTQAMRRLGLRVRRGGVPDRAAAARTGVVAIGRNGFAFAPLWGSWINIESWRVDAALPPGRSRPAPCPPECTACMRACPTQAFQAPYCIRPDRCVAYLTYGAPEPLDPELASRMGGWIYGCDTCQEICPLNVGAWKAREPAPWLDEAAHLLNPEALAEMTLTDYRERIYPRFGYLPETEAGWRRWRKNAARAMGHVTDTLPPISA